MSKRRVQADGEARAPEDLTAEERRSQRRRERAQVKSGKNRKGFGSPLRRGLLLAIPTAIVVVVVLLVFFNPFNIPSACLTLKDAPTAPYFPPGPNPDFSSSWCPQGNPTIALSIEPQLHLVMNGTTVLLPSGIGVNRTYGSYQCTLPVSTPTTPGLLPAGVFLINSPWDYQYNLSWFFQDWQATFSTVPVGVTHPNQPVIYTNKELLGFTADSTHKITLFVDGQLSNAGPSLGLSTLPFGGSPFPSCISNVYGTGHSIVLEYGSSSPTAGVHGIIAPTLRTVTLLSDWELQGWYGPAPHGGDLPMLYGSAHDRGIAAFTFAIGRGISG